MKIESEPVVIGYVDREALYRAIAPVLDMAQVDAAAGPLNADYWRGRIVAAVERAGWIPADRSNDVR